jgi:hypothetical protein
LSNPKSLRKAYREYLDNPLWSILVETVKAIPAYPHHKNYVKTVLLRDNPEISPEEIRIRLGIPIGEALVILYEIDEESA